MIRYNVRCSILMGVTFVLALAPACVPLSVPYKGGGPVASREGVELALERQSCTQNVDPDFYGEDLVEEVVEVRVRNATPNPVVVQRDAFRLMSHDGRGLKPVTWRAVSPLALNGGDTRTFELRFMNRGALECGGEMKLDPNAGLVMNGRPLGMSAISFQPSRAL